MDIRHHFIKDLVACGAVELEYVESKRNLADVFTKALNGNQHHNETFKLAVREWSIWLDRGSVDKYARADPSKSAGNQGVNN